MSGPAGHPAALFGFAPAGRLQPADREGQVLAQLTRLFGPAAGRPVRVLIQDWSRERHTYPPDGRPSAGYQLFGHPLYRRPVCWGRLHWAGTETSPDSPGHIEGAIAAGARVAAAVVTALAAVGAGSGPRPEQVITSTERK